MRLADCALAVGPVQRDAPLPTLLLERTPKIGRLHQAVPPDALKVYLDSRNLDDTVKKKPWKFMGLI